MFKLPTIAVLIALIAFSPLLDLDARGRGAGRNSAGQRRVSSASINRPGAARAAVNRARANVRPLQRTPALSRAYLNAAALGTAYGAATNGAYYDDTNDDGTQQTPAQIEIHLNSTGTTQQN